MQKVKANEIQCPKLKRSQNSRRTVWWLCRKIQILGQTLDQMNTQIYVWWRTQKDEVLSNPISNYFPLLTHLVHRLMMKMRMIPYMKIFLITPIPYLSNLWH